MYYTQFIFRASHKLVTNLYYMTNFSIVGCIKIKTIGTTKTILIFFIFCFFRIKKTIIKKQDGRQYGGFVAQDEDGLLLWTYGTMRPFF